MHKQRKKRLRSVAAGLFAGTVNGLFGTGGGLTVVPLLHGSVKEEQLFPTAVSIILPLCMVSAGVFAIRGDLPLAQSLPYLLGGSLGGVGAGLLCKKIPTTVLRRIFALFLLWGGVRLLL